jgi:hypothetical protein
MADNLTISIGADAKPAIEQIGLLQAQLRVLRKEYRQLADEIQKGGGDWPRYAEVSQQIAVAERQLRQLTQTQREHSRVTKENTLELRELGLEFGHLAHLVGLPIEGIKALRFGFAAFATGELIRGIAGVNEQISELRDLAHETRFDPATIKAWTLAVEEAGGNANTAKQALQGFGEAFLAQQKAAIDARVEEQKAASLAATEAPLRAEEAFALARARPGSSVAEARKAATEVAQAGEITAAFSAEMRRAKTVIDAAHTSLARLGVTAGQFSADEKGIAQAAGVAARSLLELNKTSSIEADILSRDVFKKPFADLEPVLKAAADGSIEAQKQLGGLEQKTQEALAANRLYQRSINELSHAWEDLTTTLVTTVGPAVLIVIEALATLVKLTGKAVDGWKELIDVIGGGSLPEATPETAARMKAAGGYISGPGSGTSDSIPAWLSNGEFVMRAAAVRNYGAGFFHALNRFDMGGLVDAIHARPVTHFAEGGLVEAASTPVHLHIGGGSFPMSASSGVAAALVVEAKRSQMISAGIKPSWYGR